MKIYDISMMIEPDMPVYKNKKEKKPVFEVVSDFQENEVHETKLIMNVHTGTHVDAPLHMLEGGLTSEYLDHEKFYTPCKVLNLTNVEDHISAADLKKFSIEKDDFILLKTKNSYEDGFSYKFIYLAEDGAEYLKEKEIRGVGIDALGIERSQPGHPTHKILLGERIIILEGLRLQEIEEGEYKLILAPLKIKGIDAAPARALLLADH